MIYLKKTVGFLSFILFEFSIHPYVQWPFNLPPNFLLVIQDILLWSFCLSAHLPLEIGIILSILDPVLSFPGSSVSFLLFLLSVVRGGEWVRLVWTQKLRRARCAPPHLGAIS